MIVAPVDQAAQPHFGSRPEPFRDAVTQPGADVQFRGLAVIVTETSAG